MAKKFTFTCLLPFGFEVFMSQRYILIIRSEFQKPKLNDLSKFVSLFRLFAAVLNEIPWIEWVVGSESGWQNALGFWHKCGDQLELLTLIVKQAPEWQNPSLKYTSINKQQSEDRYTAWNSVEDPAPRLNRFYRWRHPRLTWTECSLEIGMHLLFLINHKGIQSVHSITTL